MKSCRQSDMLKTFAKRITTMRRKLISLLLAGLLSACAQYDSHRGVDVTWDAASLNNFSAGSTTRDEVLQRLGPPSQVIALGDETVFYYLFERARGEGLILIAYNRFEVDTRYDRAVFFFDEQGRLTEYATQIHALDD